MDFKRDWTPFALQAEVEHFGVVRIATAHNRLRSEVATARREGFEEAVARERERITELVEIKRAKFNIGTRASLALSDVLDQIRARSGDTPTKLYTQEELDAAVARELGERLERILDAADKAACFANTDDGAHQVTGYRLAIAEIRARSGAKEG